MSPPAPPPARRRVLRRVLLFAALGLTAAVALVWHSGLPERWLRAALDRAALRAGYRLSVTEVAIQPYPPSVLLRGVRLSRLDAAAGAPPLLEAEHVHVALALRGMRAGMLRLQEVSIQRPVLRLPAPAAPPAGKPGSTLAAPPAPRSRPFRLIVRHLQVNDGIVIGPDEVWPVVGSAHGLRLEARRMGDGSTSIEFTAEPAQLDLPGGASWGARVEGSAALEGTDLRVERLVAEGPGLSADLRGGVALEGPLAYRAEGTVRLDLGEASGLWPQVAGWRGIVAAEGRLSGGRRTSRSRWSFRSDELVAGSLRAGRVEGEFSHEGRRIALHGEAREVLGGAAGFDYRGAPQADGSWGNELELESRGASLDAILAAVGEGGRLHGSVEGTGRASWTGLDPSTLAWSSRLQVRPPRAAPDAGAAVAGTAEVSFDGGTLRVRDADLTVGASRLRGEGFHGPAGGVLRFDVETGDPEALHRSVFAPLLERLDRSSILPEPGPVSGHLRASGELEFAEQGASGRGSLQGEDVSWRGVPLGEVGLRFELRPGSIDLHDVRIEGASGSARGDGYWSVSPSGEPLFAVNAAVGGVAVRPWLRALAGRDLPLDGEAAGSVRLVGRGTVLDGNAELNVPSVTLRGIEATDLSVAMAFRPGGRARIDGASAEIAGGRVWVSGTVDLEHGDALDLRLRGEDLSTLELLPGGEGWRRLEGTLRAEGTLRGTMAEPLVDLEVSLDEPDGKPVRLGACRAVLRGDREALDVSLQAPDLGLEVDGQIGWNRWIPAHLELRGRDMDLSIVPALLDPTRSDLDLAGRVDVSGSIHGPLRRLEELQADLEVERLEAQVGGYRLQAAEPLPLRWRDAVLRVGPGRLRGEGTDLALEAVLDTRESERTELKLRGDVNLALAAIVDPKIRSTGLARVDLDIAPGLEGVDYRGAVTVEGGSVAYGGLPFAVSSLRVRAGFEGSELTIQELSGTMGGGEVRGSGSVRFEGATPTAVRIALWGDDVTLEFPAGMRSRGGFDLLLQDTGKGYLLEGDMRVERGVYRLEFDEDRSLAGRTRVVSGGEVQLEGESAGAGERVDLALRISAPDSLVVRNDQVRIVARAELEIGGTLATPQVAGSIQALDGGTITFRGVRYRVTGGWVDFAEYGSIQPRFHVEASTSVRDWDVFLEIDGGGGEDISYSLSSYPPLSQDEILFLLITGRSPVDFQEQGGAVATEELAAYLTAPITDPLVRALGLTEVRLVPANFNASADPTARLTLVKEVHEQVRVTFSSDLSNAGEQVYLVEYAATPKMDVITSRDADGGVGADFHYVTRGYSYRRKTEDSAARDGRKIRSIAVPTGAPVEPRKLRRKLRLKEGNTYRPAEVNDAEDRVQLYLQRQGYLEADVDVEAQFAPEGVDLVLRLRPGPRYEVRLMGVDPEKKLRRRLRRSFRESALPQNVLDDAVDEIIRFYQERGYVRPQAAYRLETLAEDAKRVTFEVDPGERLRVERIELTGVTGVPEERLRKAMVTRTRGAFRKGYLHAGLLDEDLGALRSVYLAEGYQQVRVGPAEMEPQPGGMVVVRIPIEEGPRWRVGDVVFSGNQAFSEDALREASGLEVGEPVNRVALDAARTALRRHYDAAGYADARVTYSLSGDDPAHQTITYAVDEGPARTVASVEISGNQHTRKRVIDRELRVEEGDPLSQEALLQAQRRLFRLGIFRDVSVRTGGSPDDAARPVRVEVREAPNLTTGFGLGWDTVGGARGFFQLRNGNLMGRNQTLGLVLRASRIDQRAQLNFVEPHMFGRGVEGLLSGTWSDEERESFDVERLGVTLQGSKKVGPYFYRGAYRVEDVKLSEVGLEEAQSEKLEDVRLASVSASMLRDLRDDPFNPQKGFYYSIDLSVFWEGLGSERDFVKWYGQATYQMPVTRRSVWAQSLRIGLQNPFGGSEIPISERFFAGGDSTLRGFGQDLVGPTDPFTGNPTGGNVLLLLNEEYRFPIAGPVRGVVFVDVGNVYRTIDKIQGGVRWTAGGGIRYETPVGPLRLEYGWKLDRLPDESPGELYFSIGLPF